jgi:hypothetical protein
MIKVRHLKEATKVATTRVREGALEEVGRRS